MISMRCEMAKAKAMTMAMVPIESGTLSGVTCTSVCCGGEEEGKDSGSMGGEGTLSFGPLDLALLPSLPPGPGSPKNLGKGKGKGTQGGRGGGCGG